MSLRILPELPFILQVLYAEYAYAWDVDQNDSIWWVYCSAATVNAFWLLIYSCFLMTHVWSYSFTIHFSEVGAGWLLKMLWANDGHWHCILHVIIASGVAALCRVSKCAGRQARCHCCLREGRWVGSKSLLGSCFAVCITSTAGSSWRCTQGTAAATPCHWYYTHLAILCLSYQSMDSECAAGQFIE